MKRVMDGQSQGQGPAKRPASGNFGRQAPAQSLAAGNSRLTTNDALSYLRDVKLKFQDQKDIYDRFLEIMKEFKAQRINTEGVIWQVKQLFAGHKELILGFNTFLPKGYEITIADVEEEEDDKPKQPVEFDQAINYVNKIKTRFATDERVYKAFLEILNMYRKGQKNITHVYEEVAILFRSHTDLLQEFTYFLPDSSNNPVNYANLPGSMRRPEHIRQQGRPKPAARQQHESGQRNINKRKATREGYRGRQADADYGYESKTNLSKELTFFEKVKSRMRNREQYQDFLKCLNMFTEDIITKHELQSLVSDALNRHPDLQVGFNDFVNKCEQMEFEDPALMAQGKMSSRDLNKMRHLAGGDKWASRPISELETSQWETYPRLPCATRTMDMDGVLNNDWVSVTSGSEDYSFKHMRKNQYEEALFRCEDDRYELDMVIECNSSAIRAMQPLAQQLMNQGDAEDRASYRLPAGSLNAVQLRAVQRIYGEKGAQMVKLLQQNPGVAIPVILSRLQQKDGEWRRIKDDMAPLWGKVYEANYHKSLDHRSFYFKQTDKKMLGVKAMLGEVREKHDQRRARDEDIAPVLGTNLRLAADLMFDYRDRIVHDDVYKVLKYAITNIMSAEHAPRALDWYRGLIERFFALPSRTEAQEAAVVTKAENHAKERPQHRALGRLVGDVNDSGEPSAMDEGELPVDANGEVVSGDPVDPNDPRVTSQRPAGRSLAYVKQEPQMKQEVKHEVKHEVKSEDADTDMADSEDDDGTPMPGTTEVSEVDSEEDPGRNYMRCKPMASLFLAAAAAREAEQEAEAGAAEGVAGSACQKGRVCYGNESFYLLFRLHAYLYDRLRQAHKCSQQMSRAGFRPSEPEPAHGEVTRDDDDKAKKLHQEFMQMVLKLIDGRLDSSQYEDSCRALLGTNSYMLFTLDKLIAKFVKQLQTLMADDLCSKLYDLFRYEASRGSPYSDAIYIANAHVLLHDDTCYRLESLAGGDVSVQLLDPNKTEVSPSIIPPAFHKYLREFTGTVPGVAKMTSEDGQASLSGGKGQSSFVDSRLDLLTVMHGLDRSPKGPEPGMESVLQRLLRLLQPRRPFLTRNLPVRDLAALDQHTMQALQHTSTVNCLECKVAPSSSKVSYVLDTADAFKRFRQVPPKDLTQAKQRRSAAFRDWLAGSYEAVQAPMAPRATMNALEAVAAVM